VRTGQRRRNRDFKTAGSLQYDQRRCERTQTASELLQARCVTGNGEDLIEWAHVNIKTILRDINADEARQL
jgi:hypothetical protein